MMVRFKATLQNQVFANVYERGYLRGQAEDEIRNQALKAVEKFGEVAHHLLDGEVVPFAELAEVCIPIFNIAALQDRSGLLKGDLIEAIMGKSAGTVSRGRRAE